MQGNISEKKLKKIQDIYISYVKEALNVKDIKRWCSKKTLTESVLDASKETVRKNESDVYDAVKNEPGFAMGDKIYVYPVILGTVITPGGVSEKTGKPLKDKVKEVTGLKLDKYWTGDHDVEKLVDRVYATLKIFKLVLDMDKFIDYNKKSNKALLEELK